MFNKKIGIIGAGRLGSALGRALQEKKCDVVGMSSLTYAESEKVACEIGLKAFATTEELIAKADVLFFTVPDDKIVSTVTASLQDWPEEKCFFHCSGAMSADVLPQKDKIWRGSFHPLQSFANGTESLADIYISVDGDSKAVEVAKQLCEVLGAQSLQIPSADRALYHAVACIASNHLVTLLSLAQDIFARWTKTPQKALWPLVEGSLKNFQKLGEKALTGPIARGDSQTVAKHMEVLPKEVLDFYVVMSLYTLKLAEKNGNLTPEQINDLAAILKQKGAR